MFEKATRNKYRYPSVKGDLNSEQLWELPLQSKSGFDLDNVAKEINHRLKEQEEDSFVVTSTANPLKTELADKLAIVVYVIQTKQAENEAARSMAARKAEREQLLEILHSKKNAEMLGLSTSEIEARIKALEG